MTRQPRIGEQSRRSGRRRRFRARCVCWLAGELDNRLLRPEIPSLREWSDREDQKAVHHRHYEAADRRWSSSACGRSRDHRRASVDGGRRRSEVAAVSAGRRLRHQPVLLPRSFSVAEETWVGSVVQQLRCVGAVCVSRGLSTSGTESAEVARARQQNDRLDDPSEGSVASTSTKMTLVVGQTAATWVHSRALVNGCTLCSEDRCRASPGKTLGAKGPEWRERRIPARRHRPEPPEAGEDLSRAAETTNRLRSRAFVALSGSDFCASRTEYFQGIGGNCPSLRMRRQLPETATARTPMVPLRTPMTYPADHLEN